VLRNRVRALLPLAIVAIELASCAPSPSADEIQLGEAPRPVRKLLHTGDPAPAFQVESTAGDSLDSAQLFGKSATVVVFFATWCKVCEVKLPLVRETLADYGEVSTIAVSLDDVSTFHRAPEYLERHGLRMPLVRGALYPEFVLAYDAPLGVPMVVIVGRDGTVVDVQSGWASGHGERLRAALDAARLPPTGN